MQTLLIILNIRVRILGYKEGGPRGLRYRMTKWRSSVFATSVVGICVFGPGLTIE
jgi:hypothetical protein